MAHQINAYQGNPYLELGRFLQEQSYSRERKSIRLENIELDLIKQQEGGLVIGEVKKSSRFQKSASMQLAYYLKVVREYGIKAAGELRFPREKKRLEVRLTHSLLSELETAEQNIMEITALSSPPAEKWISFCRNCAYRDFCWA